MCFNSRYAGKIHRMKRITAAQIWGFNSRYAGKIHLAMHTPGNTSRVSIPAMWVRYIKKCVDEYIAFCKGFNSRYAGKIHRHQQAAHAGAGIVSIPAMRVRYISRDSITIRPTKEGFNSRYAGKIHHSANPKNRKRRSVSIPAMRVRYIFDTMQVVVVIVYAFQFPLCG